MRTSAGSGADAPGSANRSRAALRARAGAEGAADQHDRLDRLAAVEQFLHGFGPRRRRGLGRCGLGRRRLGRCRLEDDTIGAESAGAGAGTAAGSADGASWALALAHKTNNNPSHGSAGSWSRWAW
ncbi:hypothetical protein FE772_18475 [Lysobacter enzymogenes]|nr:hypothetical protein [Lysobacter enzymogenes]QCW27329.1 hypothetical protein FE772_18475 [Lysobacter enzymogenes]